MNKNIQELANQCTTIEENPFGMDVIVFDNEKFSELLLREALAIVRQEVGYYSDYDIADLIVTNVENQFGLS